MPPKNMDVTPRMHRLLDRAADLGYETLGVRTVGAEHMLRAIIDDADAIPTQILVRLGVLEQVKTELDRIMASEGYRRPSRNGQR
jgi:hypothetical protein